MAVPLYIPGITAILGPQGSGKSFTALKIGLQFCEQIQYDLCVNFPLDYHILYDYCLANSYYWLANRVWNNKIQYRPSDDLESFCVYPKTLHLLDEAGIYVNSRDFKNLGKRFVQHLAQIRHDQKLLWWIAQYHDMVDRNFRELTMTFIQCHSKTRMNKKLGNYELYCQDVYLFQSEKYNVYSSKIQNKLTGLKYYFNCKRLADRHFWGKLSDVDKMLFDIYQSFGSKVGDDINSSDFKFFSKHGFLEINYLDFDYDGSDIIGDFQALISDFLNLFYSILIFSISLRIKL